MKKKKSSWEITQYLRYIIFNHIFSLESTAEITFIAIAGDLSSLFLILWHQGKCVVYLFSELSFHPNF